MNPEVAAQLRAEFPEAETRAWERIWAGRTIFYNTADHTRIAGYSERQILVSLMFANAFTSEWGSTLHLSADEKKLWTRHFGSKN